MVAFEAFRLISESVWGNYTVSWHCGILDWTVDLSDRSTNGITGWRRANCRTCITGEEGDTTMSLHVRTGMGCTWDTTVSLHMGTGMGCWLHGKPEQGLRTSGVYNADPESGTWTEGTVSGATSIGRHGWHESPTDREIVTIASRVWGKREGSREGASGLWALPPCSALQDCCRAHGRYPGGRSALLC